MKNQRNIFRLFQNNFFLLLRYMSVASVNNGSLQLSELVISNEKYSAASGYVASSSTFSAGVTGTTLQFGIEPNNVNLYSNGPGSLIVEGTLTTDGNVTVQGTELTLGVSPDAVILECNAAGSLVVNGTVTTTGDVTVQGSDLTLGLGANSVIVSCNAAGSLTVGGTLTTSGDVTIQGSDLTLGLGANSVIVSCPSAGLLSVAGGVKCNQLADSTGSYGTAGQVPTANGSGGWAWA